VVTDRREEMETALDDVEIAAGVISPKLIVKAPRLRWYQQWPAGADWLLHYPQAMEQSFILPSTSGIHATVISEHVLAFLLAFSRRLHVAMRAQTRHEWVSSPWGAGLGPELAGQTLLLVGVGVIGKRTAQVASALGMRVLGVRHSADIVGMYVRPAWRGLRIAGVLVNTCLDWARTHGVATVKLAVVTTKVANPGHECRRDSLLCALWLSGLWHRTASALP